MEQKGRCKSQGDAVVTNIKPICHVNGGQSHGSVTPAPGSQSSGSRPAQAGAWCPLGGGASAGHPPVSPPWLVLHPHAEGVASTFSRALTPASVPWALHNQGDLSKTWQRTGLLPIASAIAWFPEGFWRWLPLGLCCFIQGGGWEPSR